VTYSLLFFRSVVPWLSFNRGSLDILIHPNAKDYSEMLLDHSERALWLGNKRKLNFRIFDKYIP